MRPYWLERFANPSSPYTFARASAVALDSARAQVARLLGAPANAISFTGGGSESNALAILGGIAAQPERREIVISAVEHACVYETAHALSARGYRVHEIPVDAAGALDLEAAARLITARTALVSCMLANNETGVIYPVAEIAARARTVGAAMHCDAVQAAGKIPLNVATLDVDMLSICAHKMYGPKGVGALYVRSGLRFDSPIRGGDQEWGNRPGTENVPGIAGFGCAAEIAETSLATFGEHARALQRQLEQRWLDEIPDTLIVGEGATRLPNTSLLLLRGVESEALLARLDRDGICASSGSACASGAHEPSRVLRAMGLARAGWGALRISTGRATTSAEIDFLLTRACLHVAALRGKS